MLYTITYRVSGFTPLLDVTVEAPLLSDACFQAGVIAGREGHDELTFENAEETNL